MKYTPIRAPNKRRPTFVFKSKKYHGGKNRGGEKGIVDLNAKVKTRNWVFLNSQAITGKKNNIDAQWLDESSTKK